MTQENELILPLICNQDMSGHNPKSFTIPGKDLNYRLSKATVKPLFPINLAFAITVYKVQGQTLDAAVLALAIQGNAIQQMKYASILVALS